MGLRRANAIRLAIGTGGGFFPILIYGDFTSPDIKRLDPKTNALLSLPATERHNDQLPIFTETALVTENARRTEAAMPKKSPSCRPRWIFILSDEAATRPTETCGSDLAEKILPTGPLRLHLSVPNVGDISWKVPTIELRGAVWAVGTQPDSWQVVSQGTSPFAHKGMHDAGKVMAAIDLISNPDLLR